MKRHLLEQYWTVHQLHPLFHHYYHHLDCCRSPLVATFRSGDELTGGWGATLVTLRP
jgi:hypothetical protein